MPFRITIDGQSITTEDLTLDEARTIELDANTNWGLINPFRTASDAKACLVALLSRSGPREEALARAGKMTVKQVLAAIDIVEEDRPEQYENNIPKSETAPDGSSTTT